MIYKTLHRKLKPSKQNDSFICFGGKDGGKFTLKSATNAPKKLTRWIGFLFFLFGLS
jgi:preprotein translocase subunit SecG